MKKQNMIDSLIENIKNDRAFLEKIEEKIFLSKEERKEILDRLKEYYADIHVFVKYMDEEQQAKLDELELDIKNSKVRVTNIVSAVAFDILVKAKDYKLSNVEWHEAYLKTLSSDDKQISYTAFNIKCRSLFNTNKVTRTKGADSKSSKDDVISLNGKPVSEVQPISKNKDNG